MSKGVDSGNHPNRKVARTWSDHGYNVQPSGFTQQGNPTFALQQIPYANAEWKKRGEVEGLSYPRLKGKGDVPSTNYINRGKK